MTNCHICKSNAVITLMDLGMQPISNRFLKSTTERSNKYPLVMGLCNDCWLVQLLHPFPVNELQPIHDWITYNEPEKHLDDLAYILSKLPNIDKTATICGISFKDDTLLERMNKLGFQKVMRLDMKKDLGGESALGGVETVQKLLNTSQAQAIAAQNGKFDIVIVRHILEHAYDFFEFMNAIKELAKPDGYIIFEVPDYTKPFEQFDYSTLWEEHIVYFTPETFKNCFTFSGLSVDKFKIYPYMMENSLVAIVKIDNNIKPSFPNKNILEKEKSIALNFSQAFIKIRSRLQSFFSNYEKNCGKIAIFGAGHTTCLLINIFGLKAYVAYVVDDNPNKQGLFMPGSNLLIISSSVLLDENIRLIVLSVNPEIEEKIIAKNKGFIENGGLFLSFCPASKLSLYTYLKNLEGITFREVSKEVYYATGNVIELGESDIKLFKEKVIHNKLQKIRICSHKDINDKVHEMFIILRKNTYIRPHKHLNKSESFYVIEGYAYVILFDEQGNIHKVIKMGSYGSGQKFYYRLDNPHFHTVFVMSDFFVFHETTGGPFQRSNTVFAPWAPEEEDIGDVKEYMARLAKSVEGCLQ